MFNARRRKLAWLFTLVLILELAILCCASVHLSDHSCSGHESCAICRYLHLSLRGSFALPALLPAMLALIAACGTVSAQLIHTRRTTLFSLKVRLND